MKNTCERIKLFTIDQILENDCDSCIHNIEGWCNSHMCNYTNID